MKEANICWRQRSSQKVLKSDGTLRRFHCSSKKVDSPKSCIKRYSRLKDCFMERCILGTLIHKVVAILKKVIVAAIHPRNILKKR